MIKDLEIVIEHLKDVSLHLEKHSLEQRLLWIQINRLERMYFNMVH